MSQPTVVLVHGAFAESASWAAVIEELQANDVRAIAAANPLRSLTGDATYLRDLIATIDGPVVLVGHSYGGMVITEAASGNDKITSLVYVCAFAPDRSESAFALSAKFPGSTLGETLQVYPVRTGGNEFVIRPERFHHQFCAELPAREAALMAATQRPVTEAALTEGLAADAPAWRSIPSWFVFGDEDRNIPVALHRFMAARASAKGVREISGASHVAGISHPESVTASILEALR